MANRIVKNPIVIDTTDTAVAGPLLVKQMVWAGTEAVPIAAANDLRIKWGAGATTGDVIYTQRPTADNLGPFTIYAGDGWFLPDGIYVEDIDGGELYIWV